MQLVSNLIPVKLPQQISQTFHFPVRYRILASKLPALLAIALLQSSLTEAGQALISWTPPTLNDDGTPLTDLTSYEIWHGCIQSGAYDTVEVIPAPASTHVASGLPDVGSCYFAAKATNSLGVSSIFSNEATRTMGVLELPGTVDDTVITWKENQDLIITNTSPGSYQWDILANGDLVYIDRNYLFTSIPSELVGLDYLRTANSDKGSRAGITFDVNRAATVFVAHDVRFSTLPGWLSSWTNTGMSIITNDASFDVYSRDFPAGNIVLGGNNDSGDSVNSMYTVIISGNVP